MRNFWETRLWDRLDARAQIDLTRCHVGENGSVEEDTTTKKRDKQISFRLEFRHGQYRKHYKGIRGRAWDLLEVGEDTASKAVQYFIYFFT